MHLNANSMEQQQHIIEKRNLFDVEQNHMYPG